MNLLGPNSQTVQNRLHRRLNQRYLRWLARQPVVSVFLSKGWRNFRRSYRRRVNAFSQKRLVRIPVVCLAVCAVVAVLGFAAMAGAVVVGGLPAFLFVSPEHHPFASPVQRDAVALTRLTVLQSVILPLLFLWASCCFCNSLRLETSAFYEKYPFSRLAWYRGVFLYLLACSAGVTLGATVGHDAPVHAVVATLVVTGCLGWLAWTAAKRLMTTGGPRWMSSQESAAGTFGIALLLLPLMALFCLGSVVVTISPYLPWLGPLGWVNGLLLGLSFGHVQNALPLGVCCVIALFLGYWLNRPTSSWAFRRRLLSNYRSRQATGRRATASTAGEPRLARDLREALSGGGWKSLLWPRWARSRVTALLVGCGTVFLMQLALAGLVLFLEWIERQSGPGTTLREKETMAVLMSCAAGWNVAVMELMAFLFRDQSGLWEFARRPVSPGQVWKQLQLEAARFAPAQVLLSIPFLALSAVLAPSHTMNSCFAVVVALLACLAIRTAVSAIACYFAAVPNLRQWIAAILVLVGMGAGLVLIMGTAASGLAVCGNLDWTPGEKALALVLQQIATLTAFGIAWGVWHAVGTSGRAAQALPHSGTRGSGNPGTGLVTEVP